MATRTISTAGGAWSSTATWAEGAVPTSADDVRATSTSGALSIDGNYTVLSFDLTNDVAGLNDGGYTTTVNGNLIIPSGVAFTSTGTWVQGASGNLSSPGSTNTFASLSIAPAGGTTTMTGNVYAKKIAFGAGALLAGNTIRLYLYPAANDFISANPAFSVTAALQYLYCLPTANVTQAPVTLPSNMVLSTAFIQLCNGSYKITATGDWNLGNNRVSVQSTTTGGIDMGSWLLTCGGLECSWSTTAASINFGTSTGTHHIASFSRHAGATSTGNLINLGSGHISCSGNFDTTGCTVTPGTAEVILTGAGTSITFAGQSVYNVTPQASVTIADLAHVTNLFTLATSGAVVSWATGVTHVVHDFNVSTGTFAPLTAATMYSMNTGVLPQTAVTGLSVSYCDAGPGKPIVATSGCTDGGNNYNFEFALATVSNASFESQGLGGAYLWQQWRKFAYGNPNPATIVDSSTAHTGVHSASIVRGSTGSSGTISQSVAVMPGTAYTWTFWSQETLAGTLDFGAVVYDDNHATYITLSGTLIASTTWAQQTFTFTTPAGCTSINLQLDANFGTKADTIYFDDVALAVSQVVSRKVPWHLFFGSVR